MRKFGPAGVLALLLAGAAFAAPAGREDGEPGSAVSAVRAAGAARRAGAHPPSLIL